MAVAGPNAQTNFLNSNRSRIYRSAGGRFFVRKAGGKKQYSPKAAFHVNRSTGATGPVTASHNIPRAIKPKGLPRRAASKRGGARYGTGGLGGTIGKNLALLFAEPASPVKRGRKSKYATNANRKAARAAYAKKYRANVKAGTRVVRTRLARAMPMSPSLFA